MEKNKYFIIFCTVPDSKTASMIAEALVKERLAACCNIVPAIQSVYFWEGEICKDSENLLIIKSHSDVYDKLEKRIHKLHPYEVPEILAVDVDRGLLNYLKWVDENVGD